MRLEKTDLVSTGRFLQHLLGAADRAGMPPECVFPPRDLSLPSLIDESPGLAISPGPSSSHIWLHSDLVTLPAPAPWCQSPGLSIIM